MNLKKKRNSYLQHAYLVKVTSASLGTKGLFERKHDALDSIPIHNIIHPNIPKPHDHEILHHLFTKIMVNTE